MTTIVRVKRHREEDPVEALVLSCKRKKTEDSNADSDSFKKILNFSGTVEEKDDKVATSTVESFKKESKYTNLKKDHIPEIRSKQRREFKERSEDNRFTLLSCLRSGKGVEHVETDLESDLGKNVTIVDVSKDNEKSTENDASDGSYVYDLYSTYLESDSDFNDLYMENLLSIQPLEYELEYRNGEDCYDEVDPDEDDSNDENNWRNDYPDSESMDDDEDDYDYDDDDDDNEDDVLVIKANNWHIGDYDSDSEEEANLNYSDWEDYYYYEAEDNHEYTDWKASYYDADSD